MAVIKPYLIEILEDVFICNAFGLVLLNFGNILLKA